MVFVDRDPPLVGAVRLEVARQAGGLGPHADDLEVGQGVGHGPELVGVELLVGAEVGHGPGAAGVLALDGQDLAALGAACSGSIL